MTIDINIKLSKLCTEMEMTMEKVNQEITDRKDGDKELWKGVNGIKAWIIAGMSSTIIAMAVFILNVIHSKG